MTMMLTGNSATVQELVAAATTLDAALGMEPHDWYFTFGASHRAYAGSSSNSPDPDTAEGFRLADRFVIVHGTFHLARARMCEIFGQVWGSQYPTREAAGVDTFGLTELVLTENTKGN